MEIMFLIVIFLLLIPAVAVIGITLAIIKHAIRRISERD